MNSFLIHLNICRGTKIEPRDEKFIIKIPIVRFQLIKNKFFTTAMRLRETFLFFWHWKQFSLPTRPYKYKAHCFHIESKLNCPLLWRSHEHTWMFLLLTSVCLLTPGNKKNTRIQEKRKKEMLLFFMFDVSLKKHILCALSNSAFALGCLYGITIHSFATADMAMSNPKPRLFIYLFDNQLLRE